MTPSGPERPRAKANGTERAAKKQKLSFGETRELETIEQRIADAEQELETQSAAMLDSAVMADRKLLHQTSTRIEELQNLVNDLYARWGELEKKNK
jgi:hypothetical protein